MNLKPILLGIALAATSNLGLRADVTIGLDGAYLYGNSFSEPLTSGSLIIAVTSPSGTYTGPTAGSLTSGDEVLLASFGIDEDYLGEPGGFNAAFITTLDSNIISGNTFAILWFPSLAIGDVPAGGEAYGFYADPSWLIPADGATSTFGFYTVNLGGDIPETAGLANRIVPSGAIPEPASFAALAGLGMLGLASMRRRRAA